MSFYQLPNPWNPGYVIPDYVMAEPPERGTFTTQWLPRGTIPQLIPDFLARPKKQTVSRARPKKQHKKPDTGHSLSGSTLACHTLSCPSLSGSSLSHSSLGAQTTQQYVLTPTGADAPTAPPAPASHGLSTGAKVAIGAGAVVLGYFAYKKLRSRRR